MKTKELTTMEFWDAMQNPAFFRISLYEGRLLGRQYTTNTPPETVDGFIENKMQECITLLGRPSTIFKDVYFLLVCISPMALLGAAYFAFLYIIWR